MNASTMAAAQDGACPWCKLPLPVDLADTSVDHIIPQARGGPDLPWNLQLLHARCNSSKWAIVTDEARALAAKHGVTLTTPRQPRSWGWRLPDKAAVQRPERTETCGGWYENLPGPNATRMTRKSQPSRSRPSPPPSGKKGRHHEQRLLRIDRRRDSRPGSSRRGRVPGVAERVHPRRRGPGQDDVG